VASLQAALNPDTQDGYLYFLGKNDGSGDLVFAKTYAQHLQNIQFYLGGSPGPSDVPSFGVPENQPTESTR
jgi:cell division protein YceG involved in septum cleavage